MTNRSQKGAVAASQKQRQESERDVAKSDRTDNPKADPTNSAASQQHGMDKLLSRIAFGVVVDSFGYLNCYRVQIDGIGSIICGNATKGSLGPMGAKELNVLSPTTNVYVLLDGTYRFGLIIGVEPRHGVDSRQMRSDMISQAGRNNHFVDKAHSYPLSMPDSGGLIDFSCGRPIDGTTAGEWGAVTETGLRVMLDSFMAQLGVDEMCGVTAFYHDQMLRIAGVQFQQWTSVSELEALDDEGEGTYIHGYTPYAWEMTGKAEPGDNADENDASTFLAGQPNLAHLEPKDPLAQPFFRMREFHGYLGQGGRRSVGAIPLSDLRYEEPPESPGLFEEFISLAGNYMVRTANSLTLAKRPAIPNPYRKQKAESGEGDTREDYKAAGKFGEGDDHKVVDGISTENAGDDPENLVRAAGLLDDMAYMFNWESLHPFHYHEKDWDLRQESELTVGRNQNPVDFGKLGKEQYLEPPDPIKVKVDHRYDEVDIIPNSSYISLLKDGGVSIGDGYGSEIRMTGGSIFITCPGDVWLQPGRNVNAYCARDFICRTYNGIDFSTSLGDVRFKAEKNMQFLSGNGEQGGGMLFESKGTAAPNFEETGEAAQHGGIILKSDGPIMSVGTHQYIRTRDGGSITVDADKGTGTMDVYAQQVHNFVDEYGQFIIGFGNVGVEEDMEIAQSIVLGREQVSLGEGGLVTRGPVYLLKKEAGGSANSLVVEGHVAAVGGQFGTTLTTESAAKIGVYKDDSLDQLTDNIAQARENLGKAEDGASERFEKFFGEFIYTDDTSGGDAEEAQSGFGNEDSLDDMGFTFRSTEEYKTEEFVLYEPRWAQLLREQGGSNDSVWEEKEVNETYPHPGKDKITEDVYRTMKLKLFDAEKGHSVERGEDYEEPKFEAPEKLPLDSSYPVIIP